jgi:predicted RND superfamily exporter protein
MWQFLGRLVIQNRILFLIIFFSLTGMMGYFASRVKISYEFSKAIPTDNPKYKDYVAFREKFGDDGNMLVIGIQTPELFTEKNFAAYQQLEKELKSIAAVENVLSIPGAFTLIKDSSTEKLSATKIFPETSVSKLQLDSLAAIFYNLPFYRSLLYNPETHSYLMAARINKDIMNSRERSGVVESIINASDKFESGTNIKTYLSGLPLIRTVVADRVQNEMKLFLIGSLILSVLILLLFFRSLSTTFLSLGVVIAGVIWSLGILYLCGYQITLLTALIPSLVVVIGIPNCIYFINKYHTSFLHLRDQRAALVDMVSKMGVVTLFCNITAAIGFAVFAFTKSAILKEFGVVAGLSIMVIFFISFILLPSVLSFLSPPKFIELKYLKNAAVTEFLAKIQEWVFGYKRAILIITGIILIAAGAGLYRLKTEGHIVDDLPKADKIYTDLAFFEKNFKGVMPLEIVIDTRKRNGLTGIRALTVFEKVDSLAQYISSYKEMNRPLSLAEGLKFAKQGFYEMDSTQYLMPNSFDGAFVADYLRPSQKENEGSNFTSMMRSFMDSNNQTTRISVGMADVGTQRLPVLLDSINKKAGQLFDSSKYSVVLTGTSITFLEGSRFIISGLKESILWAFLLIALCMLYLFRSFRILLCSLIPNVIPLVITGGIMGWAGIPLKPSTVLIFSIALGIAVDITIRFLVNYKQELPALNNDVTATIKNTIKHTGLSIIYTSLVLIAGFIIFCASSFGGTISLGWLTSLTLITATLTNLILLPVLIAIMSKKNQN